MSNIKVKVCTAVNLVILCVCGIFVGRESSRDAYMRFGPSDTLVIFGTKIDTWHKYIVCNLLVACLQMADMIIMDVAIPVLNFNIFNPDKKVITDFQKMELQLYAQTLWFTTAIKNTIMMMVTITQLDIALFKVVSGEIASVFTVRMLLNEKEFQPVDYTILPEDIP